MAGVLAYTCNPSFRDVIVLDEYSKEQQKELKKVRNATYSIFKELSEYQMPAVQCMLTIFGISWQCYSND